MYRIVTVLRQPQFKNPKYFLNFWGFLFTLAIFVCSCVQLGEGVYFLAENKRSLAYIISFRFGFTGQKSQDRINKTIPRQ